MLSLEAAATMAREMGWLVERPAIRGQPVANLREGTLTVDQTRAAKQGANHARRQTVLRTAVDCQASPSSWSLCKFGVTRGDEDKSRLWMRSGKRGEKSERKRGSKRGRDHHPQGWTVIDSHTLRPPPPSDPWTLPTSQRIPIPQNLIFEQNDPGSMGSVRAWVKYREKIRMYVFTRRHDDRQSKDIQELLDSMLYFCLLGFLSVGLRSSTIFRLKLEIAAAVRRQSRKRTRTGVELGFNCFTARHFRSVAQTRRAQFYCRTESLVCSNIWRAADWDFRALKSGHVQEGVAGRTSAGHDLGRWPILSDFSRLQVDGE
ncbi:hypothetical protein ALC57_14774 [Trachymyrmex cornetzi]|uniref:Uncharacterized protein n=1 Tax=Trachymyrmex cornetzi TaxID=471704 RepID=A0A195DJR3_9HYME|nr:hypothetical protein ALC57_14774 [Trachymyrmex cornetzi]